MGILSTILGTDEKKKKLSELKGVCRIYAYNQQKLKSLAGRLYTTRKAATTVILQMIDALQDIQNLPNWCKEEVDKSMMEMNDFMMAVHYENNPQEFAKKTDDTGRTAAYIGGRMDAEATVKSLGATAAMSIATVVGTVSTGTAISALSGAAATNAALAWLGGGMLAAGGAGIAGGSLLLGMFGPIGVAVAGASAMGGIQWSRSKNKAQVAKAQQYVDQIRHDNYHIEPKILHLGELVKRTEKNYQDNLKAALRWVDNISPKDYEAWNDEQKHELERFVNILANTVQLTNERI